MKSNRTLRVVSFLVALGLLAPASTRRNAGLLNALAGLTAPTCSAADEPAIDFTKARQLQQKKQSGETLTPEEEAYMQRAIKEFNRQNAGKNQGADQGGGPSQADIARAKQLRQKKDSGETLTPEEQAFLTKTVEAFQRSKGGGQNAGKKKSDGAPKSTTPVSDPEIVKKLVPLDELTGSYKGEDGGLYGGGKNTPPPAHLTAYLKESGKIQPLDGDGKPSKDGKIVLLSIGMSNTTMEYSQFKKTADADPKKSSHVVIVDGAQGGKTGIAWATDGRSMLPASEQERILTVLEKMGRKPEIIKGIWSLAEERIGMAGATANQVQALWIKHAEARPKGLGEFPEHARVLEADIVATLNIAKQKFPNLRVAYLSSRIFGGYATTDLNPEPYAYEEAFSMKWVIQDQIKGEPRLNFDAAKGEVKAPIVVWGPYLWANGTTPRKSDGFMWNPGDFVTSDHTHPDTTARQKVADLLLNFLETDKGSRRWFVNGASTAKSGE